MTKTSNEAIVAAAADLFRRHGYDGASMQALAEAVGILKGSLYSRFKGKEALAVAVIDMLRAELIQEVGTKEGDWRERFTVFVDRLADYLGHHKRCAALHLAYSLSEGAEQPSAALRAFFRDTRQYIVDLIGQGMPEPDARELAEDTIADLEGATLWLALEGDHRPLARAAERLKARVRQK